MNYLQVWGGEVVVFYVRVERPGSFSFSQGEFLLFLFVVFGLYCQFMGRSRYLVGLNIILQNDNNISVQDLHTRQRYLFKLLSPVHLIINVTNVSSNVNTQANFPINFTLRVGFRSISDRGLLNNVVTPHATFPSAFNSDVINNRDRYYQDSLLSVFMYGISIFPVTKRFFFNSNCLKGNSMTFERCREPAIFHPTSTTCIPRRSNITNISTQGVLERATLQNMRPIIFTVIRSDTINSTCPTMTFTRLVKVDRCKRYVNANNRIFTIGTRMKANSTFQTSRANIVKRIRDIMNRRRMMMTVTMGSFKAFANLPTIAYLTNNSRLAVLNEYLTYDPELTRDFNELTYFTVRLRDNCTTVPQAMSRPILTFKHSSVEKISNVPFVVTVNPVVQLRIRIGSFIKDVNSSMTFICPSIIIKKVIIFRRTSGNTLQPNINAIRYTKTSGKVMRTVRTILCLTCCKDPVTRIVGVEVSFNGSRFFSCFVRLKRCPFKRILRYATRMFPISGILKTAAIRITTYNISITMQDVHLVRMVVAVFNRCGQKIICINGVPLETFTPIACQNVIVKMNKNRMVLRFVIWTWTFYNNHSRLQVSVATIAMSMYASVMKNAKNRNQRKNARVLVNVRRIIFSDQCKDYYAMARTFLSCLIRVAYGQYNSNRQNKYNYDCFQDACDYVVTICVFTIIEADNWGGRC